MPGLGRQVLSGRRAGYASTPGSGIRPRNGAVQQADKALLDLWLWRLRLLLSYVWYHMYRIYGHLSARRDEG